MTYRYPMRWLPIVGLCALLQGCWFIYIPAGLFSGPSNQSKLDSFVQDIESRQAFTAVSVAKDGDRWAFGGAYRATTVEEAKTMAIGSCNEQRSKYSVTTQCYLYRVNGAIYTGT